MLVILQIPTRYALFYYCRLTQPFPNTCFSMWGFSSIETLYFYGESHLYFLLSLNVQYLVRRTVISVTGQIRSQNHQLSKGY